MRTPFKMKSSPAKGKLDNFFKGVSDKAAVGAEVRRTKQVQANQGMTNFEKRQADKAAQRKSGGKSKFQRAGAERKANRVATEKGNAANAADKAGREANSAKIKAAMDPKVSNASAYTPGKVKGSTPKAKVTTTKKKAKVVKKQTDLTKVKGSTTYVDPNKGKVIGKKKPDGTLNLDPVLDLNKKTKSKKYKAPKKKANIFSSGLDLTGKYLNKLDRALGFKTVPKFMRKYDK